MVKLRVLMWVINVTSLVLIKAWGKKHPLLCGRFTLNCIPVHLFKEAEISVPLIRVFETTRALGLPLPNRL